MSWTISKDFSGQRINRLLVIGPSPRRDAIGNRQWSCRCDCGQRCLISSTVLRRGKRISCGCERKKVGRECPRWRGAGEIPGAYLSRMKSPSRSKSVSVEGDFLWSLFVQQKRKCALTGLDISFEDRTASLDRIDSQKGYTRENVQWVHKDVNRMKNEFSLARFVEVCKRVAERF